MSEHWIDDEFSEFERPTPANFFGRCVTYFVVIAAVWLILALILRAVWLIGRAIVGGR